MRYQIVNSAVEVEGSTINLNPRNQVDEHGDEKGIPGFWVTAMKNNKMLAGEVFLNDEEALKFLQEINSSKIDYRRGFRLEFHFSSNPFFKNSVLTKTYRTIDEGEPVLEKAIGTEIEWFLGNNLTHKIRTKKSNKWLKIVSLVARTEQSESFFNFFSSSRVPDDEDLDEDAAEKLQKMMAKDYEVGLIVRDKIIPHAVSWSTGEATR